MARDVNWKALQRRGDDVDARLAASPQSETVQLEKTIIMAASAIVEAIWEARY
jgi:hypothetical protein